MKLRAKSQSKKVSLSTFFKTMILCRHHNNSSIHNQNLTFLILLLQLIMIISSMIQSHSVMASTAFMPSLNNNGGVRSHSTSNCKLYALNKNFNNGRSKVDQLPIIPVIGPILTAPPLMVRFYILYINRMVLFFFIITTY